MNKLITQKGGKEQGEGVKLFIGKMKMGKG